MVWSFQATNKIWKWEEESYLKRKGRALLQASCGDFTLGRGTQMVREDLFSKGKGQDTWSMVSWDRALCHLKSSSYFIAAGLPGHGIQASDSWDQTFKGSSTQNMSACQLVCVVKYTAWSVTSHQKKKQEKPTNSSRPSMPCCRPESLCLPHSFPTVCAFSLSSTPM